MGTILVTLAVEPELTPWLRRRQFRRVQVGDFTAWETTIQKTKLVVALVGVGARQAKIARSLALQYRPWAGIVAGVATGLKPELRCRDILVAESTCHASGKERARSDPRLIEYAMQCGAKRVPRFVSVSRVLRTAEAKSRFADLADAAEMESLAVMDMLRREGVPVAAVRAIADTVEEDVPCDFEAALDAAGQIRLWPIVRQMIHHPLAIASLVWFGVSSRRATISLTHYLDKLIETLALQEGLHQSSFAAAAQ